MAFLLSRFFVFELKIIRSFLINAFEVGFLHVQSLVPEFAKEMREKIMLISFQIIIYNVRKIYLPNFIGSNCSWFFTFDVFAEIPFIVIENCQLFYSINKFYAAVIQAF